MTTEIIATAVVVVVVGLVLVRSTRRVPSHHVGVVERFGKYARTLSSGTHLLVPFGDRVVRVFDSRPQTVTVPVVGSTADDRRVGADLVVRFAVTDAVAATYGLADLGAGISKLAEHGFAHAVAMRDLDSALSAAAEIRSSLDTALADAAKQWGTEIEKVRLSGLRRAVGPGEQAKAEAEQ